MCICLMRHSKIHLSDLGMFLSFMPIAFTSILHSPIQRYTTTMITSIQALRFIFALFILCEHFPIDAEHPHLISWAGAMGVSFFLILSGFVMSIGYEDRVKAPTFSWKDFMIRRLIRLWPLHLLCLGVWIILAYGAWGSNAIHPLPLLGNALLFQWLPIEHIGGNGVAWCLSVLIIFYAVYPLLARLKSRHLLLTFAVFSIGLLLLEPICPTDKIYWYWYISPLSRIVDFILGMLCYRFYQYLTKHNIGAIWSSLPSGCRWLVELLPILLYTVALIALQTNYTEYTSVTYFYVPGSLMILAFAISSGTPNKVSLSSIISRPWLVYLGQISFSFYMIHNLVILSVKQILSRIAPGVGWELRLAITIAVTIALSILINRYYETPIANFLSKRLLTKR